MRSNTDIRNKNEFSGSKLDFSGTHALVNTRWNSLGALYQIELFFTQKPTNVQSIVLRSNLHFSFNFELKFSSIFYFSAHILSLGKVYVNEMDDF